MLPSIHRSCSPRPTSDHTDPDDGDLGYGRDANPTWQALERRSVHWRGAGADLRSGMAAGARSRRARRPARRSSSRRAAISEWPRLIDHGPRASAGRVRRVTYPTPAAVLAAAEGADLVWLESPTNPTDGDRRPVPDRAAAASGAAIVVVDNTFATPLLQRPLELGATSVVHSATKMISGHSDVAARRRCRDGRTLETVRRLEATRRLIGAIPGPMEAYLALRGLRTLPLRLDRAQANATVLAERLARHPAVCRVRFPGLPNDPGHERAAGHGRLRLADGYRTRRRGHRRRLGRRLPAVGVRDQSRRRRVDSGAPPPLANELRTVPEGLVRLSVGIEHVEDLWADLAQTRWRRQLISSALAWPIATSAR